MTSEKGWIDKWRLQNHCNLTIRVTRYISFWNKYILVHSLFKSFHSLRGKHRLNRVLRKMFTPKRDDETGESRRLHNEGLPDLYPHQYYLGDQTKKNEIYGRCSTCGGEERCIWDFGGET